MTRTEHEKLYNDLFTLVDPVAFNEVAREFCLTDLYFLLVYVLNRGDMRHDWLYARCREVQKQTDGFLDLWAREHYKSSIITFGKTIQDILIDSEITIGIFSHTRPIAKGFMSQIKLEFEGNELLKSLFPDVLWGSPRTESPRWSLDTGLIVKRKSNPKESTVEAYGLVDGQPTSKHFSLLVYDDVVTIESVSTPEMISKVTNALELSYNLGTMNGRRRFIGTRYHFADTYKTIMDRKTAIPRLYPATEDGTESGEPVLLEAEQLRTKRRDMGPYTFGCQMLQNPISDKAQGFRLEWLKYWKPEKFSQMNLYLLCDPASKKKKGSDYTAMVVVGLGADQNLYVVDMIRDRLNLTERTNLLIELHKTYKPKATGYEEYGKDSDIEHIEYEQAHQGYRFNIIPIGGKMKKEDRIRKLIPDCEQGRFYLPFSLNRKNYEGRSENLVKVFVEDEYVAFPVGLHDDLLDCISRIKAEELCAVYPKSGRRIRKSKNRSAMVV